MKTVHKYIFSSRVGSHTFEIPRSATILTAQLQGNCISMWVEVETTNIEETRTFNVFRTGFEIPLQGISNMVYVSTVQMGQEVWHVYEKH